MVQLRITKNVFGFLFLVVVQVVILRSVFAPTLLHAYDEEVGYEVIPEFLEYRSLEQEAYNADIEELQRRLEAAHTQLATETFDNTKWQEEQELELRQERDKNEKERVEFHRLLEEATEKKAKKDRERKAKLILLSRVAKYEFTDYEWKNTWPLPSEWTSAHVLEWARRSLKLDSEDLLRLADLKITGVDLLKLRKEDFLSTFFPLGTATILSDGIATLLSSDKVATGREDTVAEEKIDGSVKRKRVVAVIGAGYGGISTARELAENGCTPILIEESKKPGGIWIYDADPNVTSGYNSLHAQGSAYDINFRQFIIPPSFSGRLTIHQMGSHIQNFWDTFGLEKYAVFNTHVTQIELIGTPLLDPPQWLPVLTDEKLFRVHWVKKQIKDSVLEEIPGFFDVDAVVEAVGRNHVPNLPTSDSTSRLNYIAGLDKFTGISIHSKSYREATDFIGKKVIVSGGGKSGQDITEDLRKANVTTIHASQNQGDRNRISRIVQEEDGSFTVHFTGEETDKQKPQRWSPVSNVTAIVWAWGWLYDPPKVIGAMEPPTSWYKDVLSKSLPGFTRVGTVSFLGTTRIQANFVGRVLAGRIPVDTNSTVYAARSYNWGNTGSDQYFWHELVTY